MGTIFSHVLITVYFLTAIVLMVYGLNCYVMLFLFQRGRKPAEMAVSMLPDSSAGDRDFADESAPANCTKTKAPVEAGRNDDPGRHF